MDQNPYAPPQAAVADPPTGNSQIEKPRQVSTATRLLWSSLGLGVINSALQWEYLTSVANVGFIVSVQIITFGILAWLTHKISSGRNWARITYLVMLFIGLLPFVAELPAMFERSAITGFISVIQLLLQIGALYLIFTEPGRRWFRRRN